MVSVAMQQTSTAPAPQAPPVPPMPTRPGAGTSAASTQGAVAPNVAGDPVQNAVNATRDGAVATRNALAEIRNEIATGIRDGFQGEVSTGTVVAPPAPRESPIPREVIPIVTIVFGSIVIMTLVAPIIRGIMRAFERSADKSVLPAAQVSAQLKELQASLDTMAIEVERISEAQRFQAKLLSEREGRLALPADGRGGA